MFNEKTIEKIKGKEYKVWKTTKYEDSKKKAIELIDKDLVSEADFWILMNKINDTTIAYNGLIISHNGCLKINQSLSTKFESKYLTLEHKTFNEIENILFIYNSPELYEVGEVSSKNCQNDYPYAMALKRCFDRVVLKLSKIAYEGIYSDSEIDPNVENQKEDEPLITNEVINAILGILKDLGKEESKYRDFIIQNYNKPLEKLTMNEGAKEASFLAENLKKKKEIKSQKFDI